jgi:ribosomal protein L37E
MDKYSETSKCSKCGYDDVDVKYRGFMENTHANEMHRTCRRCGYVWYEEPLDAC